MLEFICLNEGGELSNSYLLFNDTTIVIIDPSLDVLDYKKYIENKKTIHIFITHAHFDHIAGLKRLCEVYPDIHVYLSKKTYTYLLDPEVNLARYMFEIPFSKYPNTKYYFVSDGESLEIGSNIFKILFTPGHTNDGITILYNEMMFSGDTLFHNSIGRSDFPTGNFVALKNSLNLLCHLKKEYNIYPGHDTPTTTTEERMNNPYLKE